jgi:hypothetical protein
MLRKIGVHDIGGACSRYGRLPLYVLADVSAARVLQVRSLAGPEPEIVVRWIEPYVPLTNPEQQARDWFYGHLSDMLAMTRKGTDKRICFQGRNEDGGGAAEALWFYERERMNLMHGAGLCIGLFACSVGEFDPRVWPIFAPIIRAMRPGDFALLHEYASSPADIDNDWHICRWEHVPELRDVPKAITETGLDRVEGAGESGWRRTLNREQFQCVLERIDAKYAPRKDVVGAAPFTSGRILDPQWSYFDCNDLLDWIINASAEQGGAPVPEPPQPEQKPKKVVLPMANSDLAWYAADTYFGPYDGHPEKASDLNLELGGDSDVGQPIVSPFAGVVQYAADYGRGYGGIVGVLSLESLDDTQDLNLFIVRHMDNLRVKPGDVVAVGQQLGTIGTAHGAYAGHAHIMLCVIPIPPPLTDWRSPKWQFMNPLSWFSGHGIDWREVERIRLRDGR